MADSDHLRPMMDCYTAVLFVLAATLLLAVILTGCTADLDQVMGRVDGTPTTAPAPEQKVHCDLIFPGVDRR